jgi:hypothetical protein
MSTAIHDPRTASMRRIAITGVAVFMCLLLVAAIALWLTLGSAVFFEVVAAGIAYCF